MGKRKNWFFTDFRYAKIAQTLEKKTTRIDFEFVEMDEKFREKLQKITKSSKIIEFESAHLTVDELQKWKKVVKGKNWKRIQNPIEEMRLIKDAHEIRLMKKSQFLGEQTLEEIKYNLKAGVTEIQIANLIKTTGIKLGADDISFEPIVGFGANSAVPHHQNTHKKLKKGDMILIDMGMKFQGYCSDMTRVFFTKKPTNEQARVYNAVLEAQKIAIAEIKAGAKCALTDKKARKSLGDLNEYFKHSLGHGIGLDVHENPSLSQKSKETFKEGMVVTVEPGVYLEGKFGVRIEDMGRVTKSGYENFTKAPKESSSCVL